jgi:hypothetical protein
MAPDIAGMCWLVLGALGRYSARQPTMKLPIFAHAEILSMATTSLLVAIALNKVRCLQVEIFDIRVGHEANAGRPLK